MTQQNLTQQQQKSKLHTGALHNALIGGKPAISGYVNLDRHGQHVALVRRPDMAVRSYVIMERDGTAVGKSDGFHDIINAAANGPVQWASFEVFRGTPREQIFSVVLFTAWRTLLKPDWFYQSQEEATAVAEQILGRPLQPLTPEIIADPRLDPEQGNRPYAFKRIRPDRTGGFPTLADTEIVPAVCDWKA